MERLWYGALKFLAQRFSAGVILPPGDTRRYPKMVLVVSAGGGVLVAGGQGCCLASSKGTGRPPRRMVLVSAVEVEEPCSRPGRGVSRDSNPVLWLLSSGLSALWIPRGRNGLVCLFITGSFLLLP